MKIGILPFLIILCVFSMVAETTHAQGKTKPIPKKTPTVEQNPAAEPLTFETILDALRAPDGKGGFKNLAARLVYIIATVKQRGVTFILTPDGESDLRGAGATNDLIDAIRQANAATALAYQNRGEGLKKTADGHLAKGEYEQAIKDYTTAINEYKLTGPEIYYGRGVAYYFKGIYPSAISDLGQVIAVDPTRINAYKYRGLAYRKSGNYAMAIADHTNVVNHHANNRAALPDALNDRGLSYMADGNCPPDALNDFSQAIMRKGDFAEAYNNRGLCLYARRDYGDAIVDYNRAIEHNPTFARAFFNRGRAQFAKGESNEAVQDYNIAIKLDRTYADAYNARGEYYHKKGKDKEAISDYSQAIRFKGNFAEFYNNRGLSYYEEKNYTAAVADFEKAIDLDPTIKDVQDNLERARKKVKEK